METVECRAEERRVEVVESSSMLPPEIVFSLPPRFYSLLIPACIPSYLEGSNSLLTSPTSSSLPPCASALAYLPATQLFLRNLQ